MFRCHVYRMFVFSRIFEADLFPSAILWIGFRGVVFRMFVVTSDFSCKRGVSDIRAPRLAALGWSVRIQPLILAETMRMC